MKKDRITMTREEVERLKMIQRVMDKKLTQAKAGEILGITGRQVRRIIRRVKEEGDEGIIHGNRGRESPKKMPKKKEDLIGKIIEKRYPDFGPTLISEKLLEREGIQVGREKIRQIMIAKGLWKVGRKSEKAIHVWRERKQHCGEMVQMDGSHHDWLEGRGPRIVLMGYVDDATGRVFARFYDYEGVYPAMDSLRRYILRYGIPESLYADKHSTYKSTREANLDEELRGKSAETQFERAARELGIRVIHAHSPQAKGRIERVFGTFQDRLIKEMRLAGVSNKEAANRFLEQYLPIYNRKFEKSPLRVEDLHRPVPKGRDLNEIFCIKAFRTITDGYTIKWKGRLFVIENASIVMKKGHVLVMEDFEKNLTMKFKGREIQVREIKGGRLEEQEEEKNDTVQHLQRRKGHPQPADHPWKKYPTLSYAWR